MLCTRGRLGLSSRSLASVAASAGDIHRLYRFENAMGQERMGIARGAALLGVGDEIDALDGAQLAKWLRGETRLGHALSTAARRPRDTIARLLAPLPITPPAIYGIGLNYKRHAEETGMPLPRAPIYFMVPPTAVCGPGEAVIVPRCAQEPAEADYEVELAVVLARDAKDVSEAEALGCVLGFTVANDVSARRWQGKRGGGQWCRAKAFDTFKPVGPALTLVDDSAVGGFTAAGGAVAKDGCGRSPFGQIGSLDPDELELSTTLNGATMQRSNTSDMIFNVAQIISSLSQGTTLKAGTLILTGTPEGVGFTRTPPVWLADGDDVVVSVEGLGELHNPIVYE